MTVRVAASFQRRKQVMGPRDDGLPRLYSPAPHLPTHGVPHTVWLSQIMVAHVLPATTERFGRHLHWKSATQALVHVKLRAACTHFLSTPTLIANQWSSTRSQEEILHFTIDVCMILWRYGGYTCLLPRWYLGGYVEKCIRLQGWVCMAVSICQLFTSYKRWAFQGGWLNLVWCKWVKFDRIQFIAWGFQAILVQPRVVEFVHPIALGC